LLATGTTKSFNKRMRFFKIALLVVAFILVGFILINYYSYIFAKTVKGEIVEVERVTDPTTIVGSQMTPGQLYSFAVAIRADDGEIFTASSEDRQWAVAKKGFCAVAKFYPYPFWQLDSAGTYHNARLIELRDCKRKQEQVPETPEAASTPS
jgi:hypothetical protein